jgi:ribosomal protein L11 methylase PrmA
VVANIESGILRPLLPGFRQALEPGGWLILSGITRDEWPGMLEDAERAGFRLLESDADGEWMSGRFVREE